LITRLKVGEDVDRFALSVGKILNFKFLWSNRSVHVCPNKFIILNAPSVAIEGDAHAFAWTVSNETVVEHCAGAVAHVE